MSGVNRIITVLGPTATGKTTFAAHLANMIGGEIISADSRQVYRGMDLGTGKDLEDYTIKDVNIPYHLIDIADPGYEYNVYEFQRDFLRAYQDITKREKAVIMCGGTGLYLDSVINSYELNEVPHNHKLRDSLESKSNEELEVVLKSYKNLHNVSDTSSRERMLRAIEIQDFESKNLRTGKFPEFMSLNFGIFFERQEIKNRITERLDRRLKEGMIEEVENLLNSGVKSEDLIFYGLEYKLVTQHVIGDLSFEEMFKKLEIAIHQFSKRQMTWFRRMEKQGVRIHWIDGNLPVESKISVALQKMR